MNITVNVNTENLFQFFIFLCASLLAVLFENFFIFAGVKKLVLGLIYRSTQRTGSLELN